MTQAAELETVLDSLNDAVYLHDPDGNMLYVNQAACDRLGYTEAELLSMSLRELDAPGARTKIAARVEELERRGELVFETTHLTHAGERVPIEINACRIMFRGDPAILSVARDITERKEREEALRSANQRLEAIIDASPDAIIVVDPEGIVETWNPAAERIFGWSAAEAVGSLNPIIPVEKREEFHGFLDRIQAGDTITSVETVRQTKGGEMIHVNLSTAAIRDSDGNVTGIMGILQDISERKAYESAIEQTNEQLRVLNRITRHDIRNDLNVVFGWSQELDDHVDDEGMAILDRIQNTSKHVIDLTKTVRDFVEGIGTDEQPELRSVNLYQVIEAEVAKRRDLYPAATFDRKGEAPEVTVEANELLSSVFRNILNNAVQHNPADQPVVTIDCEVDQATVTVSIADNGPGIPNGQKDAIFGRSEDGLDDPAAGVGLYLVDELVESYDGAVWVKDNEPAGSVFVVELPRAEANSPAVQGDQRGDEHAH